MDGFTEWARERGLPETVQVDGDEVVITPAQRERIDAIKADILAATTPAARIAAYNAHVTEDDGVVLALVALEELR
jgi:hypothetical protein